MSRKQGSDAGQDELVKAFTVFDKDGAGFISISELRLSKFPVLFCLIESVHTDLYLPALVTNWMMNWWMPCSIKPILLVVDLCSTKVLCATCSANKRVFLFVLVVHKKKIPHHMKLISCLLPFQKCSLWNNFDKLWSASLSKDSCFSSSLLQSWGDPWEHILRECTYTKCCQTIIQPVELKTGWCSKNFLYPPSITYNSG